MILVFIGLLVLSALLAVTIGAVKVSIGNVYRVVIYQLSLGRIVIGENSGLASGTLYEIVWNLRMPRVLLGAVIGILLSMCGVVMQATVQNPLADPYILGISSGASLGATFSIMSQTLRIAAEEAIRFSNRYLTGCSTPIAFVSDFASFSSALFRHATMSSTLKGLVM